MESTQTPCFVHSLFSRMTPAAPQLTESLLLNPCLLTVKKSDVCFRQNKVGVPKQNVMP